MNPVLFSISIAGYVIEMRFFGMLVVATMTGGYVLYIWAVLRKEFVPIRSSWGLWMFLDMIAFASLLNAQMFDPLLAVYAGGVSIVFVLSIFYGKNEWSRIETLSTVAVVVAIILWMVVDPIYATICSIAGVTTATFPLYKKAWFESHKEPLLSWGICFMASVWNALDGQLVTSTWFGFLQMLIIVPTIWQHHKNLIPKFIRP